MTDPKTHRYRQIAGKSPTARLALAYRRRETSPQPMSIGAVLFAASIGEPHNMSRYRR
jgi:hypothetical protein